MVALYFTAWGIWQYRGITSFREIKQNDILSGCCALAYCLSITYRSKETSTNI